MSCRILFNRRLSPIHKGSTAIYTCITVSGPERTDFLQGQLTQDVASIAAGGTAPAAWCSPKGRVLVTARLLNLGEAVAVFVPEASADATVRRLGLYRLRAKVELDIDPTLRATAVRTGDLPDGFAEAGDDPLQTTGTDNIASVQLTMDTMEMYGPAEKLEPVGDGLSAAAWRSARIAAGLVDIDGPNAERYTPHMLNLDQTGAISFDKGCYTGQEVVARTQHLGRVKRRVNRYRLLGSAPEPATVGDKLSLADGTGGDIVNAAGSELLAVVPVERFAETATLSGKPAEPQPLPYLPVN